MQGICRSGEITYYFKEFKSSSQQIYALVTSVHHARRYTNFFLSIWIQDSKKIATRLLAAFVSTCSIWIRPAQHFGDHYLDAALSVPGRRGNRDRDLKSLFPSQCQSRSVTAAVAAKFKFAGSDLR
jgi:hypothetical protein